MAAFLTHSVNWKTITNLKNFGAVEFDQDLVPATNNYFRVGVPTRQWMEFYVYNGAITEALTVGTDVTIGRNLTVTGTYTFGSGAATTLTVGTLSDRTISEFSVDSSTNLVTPSAVLSASSINATKYVATPYLSIMGLSITDKFYVSNTTDATSSTDSSASIKIDGGLALAKAAYIGTTLSVGTSITVPTLTVSTTLTSGAFSCSTLSSSGQTDLATSSGTTSIGASTKLTITSGGLLTVANTTEVSGSSASITTAGGIYCAKRLYVASTNTGIITPAFHCAGSAYFVNGVTSNTFLSTNTYVIVGTTLDVGTTSSFAGVVSVNNATAATTSSNGALVVAGGIGCAGNSNFGGVFTVSNTSEVVEGTPTASLKTAGGIYCAKRLYVASENTGIEGPAFYCAGSAYIVDTVFCSASYASTNTSSGALVVTGGIGCGGNSYFGGITRITNNTTTTTASTGALVVTGGIGCGNNLFVTGDFTQNGYFYGKTSDTRIYAQGGSAFFALAGADASIQTPSGALQTYHTTNIAAVSGTTKIGNTGSTFVQIGTSGDVFIQNATDSTTSTSNSGLRVAGGVSVAKAVHIGTTLGVAGATTLASSSGTTTIGATNSVEISTAGVVSIVNSTESTSTTTGCLKCTGGIGVAKSVTIGKSLKYQALICTTFSNSNDSNQTYVSADILGVTGGYYFRSGLTATRTDTLPTAALLSAALGYLGQFSFTIVNNSSQELLINMGSGGTVYYRYGLLVSTSINSILAGKCRTLTINVTSANPGFETYDCFM